MYVREDFRGAQSEPACKRAPDPTSHRGVGSGLVGLLAAPVLMSMLISPTTPSVASTAAHVMTTPTQLLATYVLAPTDESIISTIHGQALVDLMKPYVEASKPGTDPGSEVVYPASTDSTSLATGLANLEAASGFNSATPDPAPVFAGISQGAVVISLYKQAFNEKYAGAAVGSVPTPTFVLVGNPSRPNGGLSERLAALGVAAIGGTQAETITTPTTTAGAAPGQLTTYDYARQYDFFADFPNRPLNPFSTVNALFGAILAHGSYGQLDSSNGLVGIIMEHNPYGTVGPQDAVFQATQGDTAYYLIPSTTLPMLQPLGFIGVPQPIIDVLDAPLRVLVEAGYDRTVNPGTPTGIELSPVADPVKTAVDFAIAIPTGLDDGLSDVGLGRPLGTTPAGPYGVGGPSVTLPGQTAPTTTPVSTLDADAVEASTTTVAPTTKTTHASEPSSLVRRVHLPGLDGVTKTAAEKAGSFGGVNAALSKLASLGSKRSGAADTRSTDSNDSSASTSRHRAQRDTPGHFRVAKPAKSKD